MVTLHTPLDEASVRALRAGDMVSLSGIIITARDKVHSYLIKNRPDIELLRNSVIYHSGPLVREHLVLSAGPTTSARLEPYMAELISYYGIKAIIGKGGMGQRTLEALSRYGCVYLQATGGAGVYLASKVRKIVDVMFLEEFGMPEAMWVLEVQEFPAIVTMDSHGESLHEKIKALSCR